MTRRVLIAGILAGFALSVAPLTAHDNYRVVGTITKIQDRQLDVKTREGKTFSMGMNDYTRVKRDKTTLSIADLKLGLSVVVDARGDNEQELMADDVRIVPAIAAPAKKKK